MNQVKTLMAIALSLPVLFLSGCKSVPRYSSDYANARASIQGIPLDDAKALEIGTRFTSAFNTLGTLIYAELSGDFPLGDSRQPTYKSLRPFDLVS